MLARSPWLMRQEIERQPLAEMAENITLSPGWASNTPDSTKRMPWVAGLDIEAPAGAQQPGVPLGVILVVGLDDGGLRERRVDVDRHVERGGALVDRPEPLVVVKTRRRSGR